MRKLKQNGKFSLFGADAAADAVVGARLGFFINARGGICVLSGVSLALGASVEVAALTFFKQGNDQSREQRGPKNTNVFLENIFAW